MNERLELRLYGLVPYQLSGIQAGIQFGHALQEYNNEIFDMYTDSARGFEPTPESKREIYKFEQWRIEDKTFIILNGGTTNKDIEKLGTLNDHRLTLREHGIKISDFYEPDLGDQLTAVVFLVDERVFNREKYPDYNGLFHGDGTPLATDYNEWKLQFGTYQPDIEKIIFLRDFLKPFKLA
jgi:hypothetical protein